MALLPSGHLHVLSCHTCNFLISPTCLLGYLVIMLVTLLMLLLILFLADDIGWILKLFKESLERKEKVHRNFPDRACEELLLCKKWVDPNVEVEPEIEAIFS